MSIRKLTPNARTAIIRLGEDISTARRKRRISQKDFAAKMGVSISTVQRLEAGEPGIAIGVLAMAFIALGTLNRLREILDVSSDDIGLVRDQAELPQRIRRKRSRTVSLTGQPSGDRIKGLGL